MELEPARYAGCEELVFEEAKHVLERANEEIYRSTANGHICGSTVVLLLVWEKKSFLLSVGDSRCYLLPGGLFGGSLVRLTRDDVWENSAAAAGVRQKENHPDYGKLTNAVGIGTGVRYTACTDLVDCTLRWRRRRGESLRRYGAVHRIFGCINSKGTSSRCREDW